jgi:hypothetical protein
MEAAYSPINNSHNIQRIVCPKKKIRKDKSSLRGKRNIKMESTSDIKILRKLKTNMRVYNS